MPGGTRPVAPHELLDDGTGVSRCDLFVVGCGNILRGDDAVGPTLVRLLWSHGDIPQGVRMLDGGTAGMDVGFQMRGAAKVVIVDASSTGAEPGTIYRVPGDELAQLPPIDGIHTHSFRWDHAISFGRWLLGPQFPSDITVFLIEAAEFTPGGTLSARVEESMRAVAEVIRRDFFDPLRDSVEITDTGNLRIDAALAQRYFPAHVCGLKREGDVLVMIPLASQANGGALLKQRTPSGDRALLVREVLDDDLPVGRHTVTWDERRAVLLVDLAPPS
ncbi:MAG: hydrogenase maturation protease [Tetrasphaera sp.]|nr:hydrogenase maturation protease [Tetrasphaera sp.]